ncbi:DUF1218 domain-containing protein [Cephalotus follicularis]|uniref:DUF1218 domain-containing protein n=1 Tax=Cephalotus follicularis TaxID=3775 RepID=A0A1Q3D3G2_CEPFO|nr:DUF1218 domain-containing protein [Cephalotus follicularis]
MQRKALIVCSVVGFLGLLSAATGFGAEATRIKASEVQLTSPTDCSYPQTPALGLGLTASVALLVAQLIINVVSGCICCRKGPRPANPNWTLALICFVLSWFTFVIAFLLFLTGAALNNQNGGGSMYIGNYCYVVKPGVFAGGAVLSLASVTFGIIYFLALNSVKNNNDPLSNPSVSNQGGIAMGQPQFPTYSGQQPVFVHEDTYMRRQFT